MQYATKAARMAAFIIDEIIIMIIVWIGGFISWGLGFILFGAGETLYFGFMEGSNLHATLGKYLMGIVTVDENGNPLDYGKSFTRAVCRILSTLIVCLGFLIGLFDDEGKTLHDRIAGTRVITKESMGKPAYAAYGNQGMQQPAAPVAPAPSAAQPKLIGVAGRYAGQAYLIGPQGIMMGRDQSACEFVFDQSTNGISRTHCKITYNPQTGMFVLYDLGSSYGTFLANGVQVPQGQPMAIRPGEQFYLADRGCMFMVNL